MHRANLPLSDKMLELVARRFRLLGEPFRLRILQLLENREITVNEIVDALKANQSNVSKHLGLLYDGGLVSRRREGTSTYYFISDPVVMQLCDLVCHSATEEIRAALDGISVERIPAKQSRKKSRP